MKSYKKIVLLVAIFIFAFGLICVAFYLKSVADYQKSVKKTTFSSVEISEIPDGIYFGEYDVNFICAKVKLTVQNGKIASIDILEHKNGRGKPAEIVADKIIETQKIDVDAVSGATNSSIIIKKAVENALLGNK